VSKYFAIIPAMFAATYPELNKLNIMRLHNPQSAVLAAVIFMRSSSSLSSLWLYAGEIQTAERRRDVEPQSLITDWEVSLRLSLVSG